MSRSGRGPTVVVDACVLINLAAVDRFDLLGALERWRFLVPDLVVEQEVLRSRRRLDRALASGWIERVPVVGQGVLATFTRLAERLGEGESACLALAQHSGDRRWWVASDERRRFLREARRRLGPDRIVTTPGLLLAAIRCDVCSVREADRIKAHLESHRFRMTFGSFQEFLE